MRFVLSCFSILAATTSLWACTSGTPEAEAPSAVTSPAAATAEVPAEPVSIPDSWQEGMTSEQQIAFMKERVIPAMTPVFQAYDKAEYAEFGCATCHGPEYKTPTEYLPALTMKNGQLLAFEEEPAMAKWMAEKVVPAMAQALGTTPYNPETQQGFGCGGCHAIEQE